MLQILLISFYVLVAVSSSLKALIDQTGRVIVSPQYDDINYYDFVETGLIKVKLNNK